VNASQIDHLRPSTEQPKGVAVQSSGVQTLACCLSGLMVGTVAGLIGGRLAASSWGGEQVVVGVLAGGFIGLVAGRKIAGFETVLGGATFGAFLPFGLCVLDGIRNGRFKDLGRVAKETQEPQFLLVAALFVGVGGTLGASLVAGRKLIARVLGGSAG
jgi:hypothetical protein